ncbi:hypothetical protein ABZX75_12510 [Streptomyces sp. NPDC003038]|uniref:hypothetical protein n=1 Tax=unclassified Streptomyces TaxID=2593676 RepID=UPI0033BF178E
MSTQPAPRGTDDHGSGDPSALPAALGLGLLAAGGWLLTTARPWQKPGHPLTLGLGWAASGALLLCGLVLLARCVRSGHRAEGAPYGPGRAEAGRDAENDPVRPA